MISLDELRNPLGCDSQYTYLYLSANYIAKFLGVQNLLEKKNRDNKRYRAEQTDNGDGKKKETR